jgi:hypothetical protein
MAGAAENPVSAAIAPKLNAIVIVHSSLGAKQ